ncbi:DUF4347 domain-containing protein [Thalassoglobus sp. JC818]|uniref:DUF4347 domain-containing protein n=1 Tax=Thalassoglobus sp. JC818 TaxID=3232136 RepID=UPI00345AC7FF
MAKKRASQNPVKYYDFEFIGTNVNDPAGRIYSSKDAYPRFVKDLAEISNFVFEFSIASDHLPRRVAIVTHGSTDGFWVGQDYVSMETIQNHSESFGQLGLLMLPGIATLELYSCRVGRNRALLRRISSLLRGTPVIAYEEAQPASGESSGRRIRCKLDRCGTREGAPRRRRKGSSRPFAN